MSTNTFNKIPSKTPSRRIRRIAIIDMKISLDNVNQCRRNGHHVCIDPVLGIVMVPFRVPGMRWQLRDDVVCVRYSKVVSLDGCLTLDISGYIGASKARLAEGELRNINGRSRVEFATAFQALKN